MARKTPTCRSYTRANPTRAKCVTALDIALFWVFRHIFVERRLHKYSPYLLFNEKPNGTNIINGDFLKVLALLGRFRSLDHIIVHFES